MVGVRLTDLPKYGKSIHTACLGTPTLWLMQILVLQIKLGEGASIAFEKHPLKRTLVFPNLTIRIAKYPGAKCKLIVFLNLGIHSLHAGHSFVCYS